VKEKERTEAMAYCNVVQPRQVKTEASASPDLSPADSSFQFKFHASHGSLSHSPVQVPHIPLFRFGHWPSSLQKGLHFNQLGHSLDHPAMSYSDDYDDLAEIPPDQQNLANYAGTTSVNDRAVRRRSSKGTSPLFLFPLLV